MNRFIYISVIEIKNILFLKTSAPANTMLTLSNLADTNSRVCYSGAKTMASRPSADTNTYSCVHKNIHTDTPRDSALPGLMCGGGGVVVGDAGAVATNANRQKRAAPRMWCAYFGLGRE